MARWGGRRRIPRISRCADFKPGFGLAWGVHIEMTCLGMQRIPTEALEEPVHLRALRPRARRKYTKQPNDGRAPCPPRARPRLPCAGIIMGIMPLCSLLSASRPRPVRRRPCTARAGARPCDPPPVAAPPACAGGVRGSGGRCRSEQRGSAGQCRSELEQLEGQRVHLRLRAAH